MDRNFVIDQHGGGGPSAFAWTCFAILLIIMAAVLVSLVLDFYYRSNSPATPLVVLDERYARGELSREAYLQARGDLGGQAPPPAAVVTSAPPEPEPA